jgi:HK97 gp10 family phage protein
MPVVTVGTQQGGVRGHWEGTKIVASLNKAARMAAERSRERAVRYWAEEWSPSRHPYMTGNEESILRNGYWRVSPQRHGHIHLYGGSTSPHTIYEEFGTSHQPAHAPIRKTFDRVKYTLADDLRWAMAQNGFKRGRGRTG